jgi:DNA-binding protein Fis
MNMPPVAGNSRLLYPLNLDEANAVHITEVLKLAKGKIDGPGGAAELLGINPSTLRSRLDKLGIGYRRRGRIGKSQL